MFSQAQPILMLDPSAIMKRQHHYPLTVQWTGNQGEGTKTYTAYERSHTIQITNKADILGSSDSAFRGDPTRHNPEELLVASVSTCHMLWFLHLCAQHGIIVTDYVDNAMGTLAETLDGGGHFTEVTLHPRVTVTDASMIDRANELHTQANNLCFIANSCNFPVHHQPSCQTATAEPLVN